MAFTRWRQGESRWRLYVIVLGLAVVIVMGWRELRGGRWRRISRRQQPSPAARLRVGLDSEFYRVADVLERWSSPRPETLAMGEWIDRLPALPPSTETRLRRILGLHYRLRFDPAGLSQEQRSLLRNEVRVWLEDFRRGNRAPPDTTV